MTLKRIARRLEVALNDDLLSNRTKGFGKFTKIFNETPSNT
jgi:hypothetical protein